MTINVKVNTMGCACEYEMEVEWHLSRLRGDKEDGLQKIVGSSSSHMRLATPWGWIKLKANRNQGENRYKKFVRERTQSSLCDIKSPNCRFQLKIGGWKAYKVYFKCSSISMMAA